MSRIPYFDIELAPDVIKEQLKTRKPLNIYRMLAHATTVAPGFLMMGRGLLRESELDPQLRELAILRVGILGGASYEIHQHKRVAASVGISDAKIEAIREGAAAPIFSDLERLVLAFTDEVVCNVKAGDALFDDLLKRLNHRQMAELVLTIGFYMMVCRFLENFEVDIEPPGTFETTAFRGEPSQLPSGEQK